MPAPSSSARHTPEVIGDYVGGSNHVLPTARSARFSSGLSVLDYVKRTSVLQARSGAVAVARSGCHNTGASRRLGCPCALGVNQNEPLSGHGS
jgi:hypothetical protein